MGIFEIGETLTDAGTNENEICNYLMKYNYIIEKILYQIIIYFI